MICLTKFKYPTEKVFAKVFFSSISCLSELTFTEVRIAKEYYFEKRFVSLNSNILLSRYLRKFSLVNHAICEQIFSKAGKEKIYYSEYAFGKIFF